MLISGEAIIIDVFGDAAGGISTHFALRAVGIEHAHSEIGNPRRHDSYQAVRTHALVSVAHCDSESAEIVGAIVHAIEVDVIIASPVHFSKPNRLFHLDNTVSYKFSAKISILQAIMQVLLNKF